MVQDKNLSWRHAKKVIFMAFQWSKAQFFLSRLWITIHFLKGLCMTSMIKLVKHKWRSLQTRTLPASHDSMGLAHIGSFNLGQSHLRQGQKSPTWQKSTHRTKVAPWAYGTKVAPQGQSRPTGPKSTAILYNEDDLSE